MMREEKIEFDGELVSVQPRIRLLRSFDERSHNYLGFALRINGFIGDVKREFTLGIGKSTQEKFEFVVGDRISGECVAIADSRQEPVEFYKASKIKKTKAALLETLEGPPWIRKTPSLEEYRSRGHRRLSTRTYETSCNACIWGCRMPVEIIIDNWNPRKRQYRYETFCYGPKVCRLYKAGPTRKVPGRNGMSYEELDWVDEQETEHRGPEE